ncbi:O-Antigen ligase [Posidoniimonas polymericola]|uniref:O-Antigen ligase n=1 Tax=Posidoniimonas polymericola TaxID=2528002 RepID=A0A5C5YM84_9BACT|nr:O-antigen ligase family protein [Posidoniimonas polymericola]TWT75917.1 O-Antigen ligase [Posidoniimonas polymericola]
MPVVLLLAAIAGMLWALFLAQRSSLLLATLATAAVGYVLGHSFWNAHIGPLPLTLDRLLLAGVTGLFAYRAWRGQLAPRRIGGVEWALAALLVWLTFSALTSKPGGDVQLPTSPLWRLLFSFWAPALLLFIGRGANESNRAAYWFLAGLTALGSYLALTAVAETAGVWSLVFPRYISDPMLGLHYGRARGPALNSVSLGIHLTVCVWAAWLLLPRAPQWAKLPLLVLGPLMVLGILLTFTRSVWLGMIASGVAMLAVQIPRRFRGPVLTGLAVLGIVAGPIAATSLVAMKREDSGHMSQHSVQQRTAFAYVSWKMFQDHPLTGVGFGRFYDQKLPYLSDRSQTFELESLRELHHHNTLLSLLTETGMIGLAAYLGVLYGLLRASWRLANSHEASDAGRRLGALCFAAIAGYLPSAVFHDLSLVHSDQWLLFLVAGAALGFERRLGLSGAGAAQCESPAINQEPAFSGAAGLQ